MPQMIISTPPPPPDVDLSDADLLVIKAAAPTPQGEFAVIGIAANGKLDQWYEEVLTQGTPDKSHRNRISFKLELNLRNRSEFDLAAWLDDLKAARQFTRV